MRKIFCIFILLLMSCIILAGTGAAAAEDSAPRVILYTYYRQMGWGDRVQIGWLDEDGNLRLIPGFDSALKWPYKPEEQLAWLEQAADPLDGSMPYDELFSVKSLIYDVEDQGSKSVPAANDAGTEKSYAVQYSPEGEPSFVLLGMSGDDMFENSDPNAQALYLRLRRMFPTVTTYAYGPMGPAGFVPVPLAEFTGLDPDAVGNAEIEGCLIDCEVGPIPLDLSTEDKASLVYLIRYAKVTGKADCVVSTGGMASYSFYDAEHKLIGTLDFEDGLLISGPGHYYFEWEK